MVSDVIFRFTAASGRGFGTVNVAPVDMFDLVEVVRAPVGAPYTQSTNLEKKNGW